MKTNPSKQASLVSPPAANQRHLLLLTLHKQTTWFMNASKITTKNCTTCFDHKDMPTCQGVTLKMHALCDSVWHLKTLKTKHCQMLSDRQQPPNRTTLRAVKNAAFVTDAYTLVNTSQFGKVNLVGAISGHRLSLVAVGHADGMWLPSVNIDPHPSLCRLDHSH